MAYSTIGVVVEKSRDNLVFVTEIQTGRAFVVTDKAAKAYQSGDILTLNLTTKTFVDAAEDYPFVQEETDMAEEKEPLDNSRLGKSKRKLVRLQNELNDQIEKMFEHQRKTNGQPMNDKRNGHS